MVAGSKQQLADRQERLTNLSFVRKRSVSRCTYVSLPVITNTKKSLKLESNYGYMKQMPSIKQHSLFDNVLYLADMFELVIEQIRQWGGPLCLIKRPGVLQAPNCKRLLKPFLAKTKRNASKGKAGGMI